MPNLNDLKKEAETKTEEVFDPNTGETTPVVPAVAEPSPVNKPIAQSVWDEIVNAGETVPNNDSMRSCWTGRSW